MLESWLQASLAHPVTKLPIHPEYFRSDRGIIDARVFLKNSHSSGVWEDGQQLYERFATTDPSTASDYEAEIRYDRPVYDHYKMLGRILDCGGGAGTVREFLPEDVEFVSVDPWLSAPFAISAAKRKAYKCLERPLNFIGATAEFLPFVAESFDWVHMRSMLDHVQVHDLVLLEARRVLRPEGQILIGLYVDGGRTGIIPPMQHAKAVIKTALELLGVQRWRDPHVWHPTYKALLKLIGDNGFIVEDTYWQPHWNDTVCYVRARKQP